MSIKEAQEIIKNGWETEAILSEDFLTAQDMICEALKNDYVLCNIGEATREMKAVYELSGAGNILECVEILKENCQ